METLLYITKSTALLSLFFLIYEFLLKRDTFFALNRFYLFFGILVAALLPLLTFTETIVVEENLFPVNTLTQQSSITHSFPSEALVVGNTSFWSTIDYTQFLVYLYLLGTVFFLIKFAISLMKLRAILNHRPNSYRKDGIRFVETDLKTNPFTFFKTVVYNPTLHRQDELDMILHHEKTHARNWHSLDILFGQLIIAFHWFNPLVWLYSKRIDQNLEFIADHKTTENQFPKKSYQLSLLRTAIPDHLSLPVNNFHSFTKVRILMLNRNKSRHINRLKALLVLPFIMVFLMSFQVETVTQIKTTSSSHIEADSISNPEVDLLKSMLKDYNEDAVLIFNGKKTTVKGIVPSLYKVEEVKYDAQGIPFIQGKIEAGENLKVQSEKMSKGIYLQVLNNARFVILTRNDSDTEFSISVFSGGEKEVLDDDKNQKASVVSDNATIKEAQSNSSSNISRKELELDPKTLEDSLRIKNQEFKFDIHYELLGGKQKQRQMLEIKRQNLKDPSGTDRSKLTFTNRDKLQQERMIEMEKRSGINQIVSVQVFKDKDYKEAVAVDKNEKTVVLRFEIDENTSDASLDQIVSKFAEVDVDFKYKVTKRDRAGKITKIRMSLNNRKGSQSKVNNQSSTGIGSYILGLNENGSIYIRKIN